MVCIRATHISGVLTHRCSLVSGGSRGRAASLCLSVSRSRCDIAFRTLSRNHPTRIASRDEEDRTCMYPHLYVCACIELHATWCTAARVPSISHDMVPSFVLLSVGFCNSAYRHRLTSNLRPELQILCSRATMAVGLFSQSRTAAKVSLSDHLASQEKKHKSFSNASNGF